MFSHQDMSNSLQPHGLQHTGLLVPHHLPDLPKFMSTEAAMPSNHLILCCPLLLLPSIFPSTRIFSNESDVHIGYPNYWSFSFSNQAFQWVSQVSIKIDLFALLAFQGILKSLLYHHSLKASFLWHSAFFIAQLSQLYMTSWNTIALIIWTCVTIMTSLLFNTLSRFS